MYVNRRQDNNGGSPLLLLFEINILINKKIENTLVIY